MKNKNEKQRLFEMMARVNPSFKKNLNESTIDDKYEDVVFLQGEEAEEPLRILDQKGEDAALEYLKQWHYPGEHMGRNELGHGTEDYTYEKDGYIMSWNRPIGYIGLMYKISDLNEYYDDEIRPDINEKDGRKINESTSNSPINKFVYFALNYPSLDFIDDVWSDDLGLAKHLRTKFEDYYDRHSSTGAMTAFYANLSGGNQRKLEDWIINNYGG